MLISHSNRFIFIHLYKVAGTSITKALAPFCNFKPSITHQPLSALKGRVLSNMFYSDSLLPHASAFEIKNAMGEKQFNQYFKFTFVRNPWDWQVSLYEYAKQTSHHHEHDLISGFKSFSDYIKWRVDGNFRLQSDFILSDKGDMIVNYIGKMEDISHHFEQICVKLELGKLILPHSNSTKRKDYKAYYNSKDAQIIADVFEKDISRFEYSF